MNWASTLEVAFRALSWIWVDHLIATADPAADDFRTELRQAIGEHAVYIDHYLSTYFAPNTHLLGEALALFFIGVLYPQFEMAQRWRDRGWQILLEQSARQVRADGFHFEQSVYYHVYALDMFLWAQDSGCEERHRGSRESLMTSSYVWPRAWRRSEVREWRRDSATTMAAGYSMGAGIALTTCLIRSRPPESCTIAAIGKRLPVDCERNRFGC